MEQRSFGLHETLEVHEILNFKTVCMTKSKTMQLLVTDEQLKALMQRDVEQSRKAVDELQSLLEKTQMQ